MDLTRANAADLYEQATSSIADVVGMLGPDDWNKSTDCPAWTVKDIVAHLSAFEAIATGLATHAADADVSRHPHAAGFNETIEKDVEARRDWEPSRIVDEFRDSTIKRAEQLRGSSDEAFETETLRLPFGDAPAKNMMPIRFIDLYFHEQDIRRATGHPGHLDGELAKFCFERMRLGLPAILGKRVGLEPGQSVVLNLTSHSGTTIAFGVNAEGRVAEQAEVPHEPTVRIVCDLEHFLMLTGGRGSWRDQVARGDVTIADDRALGEKILENIVVTP